MARLVEVGRLHHMRGKPSLHKGNKNLCTKRTHLGADLSRGSHIQLEFISITQ